MTRQQKNRLSRQEQKRLRHIILLVGVIVVLMLIFFPGRSFMSYHQIQKQVSSLSRKNRQLEQRNRELAAEIERLQTDDAYLEELARKKYGLLKDNETVYEFKRRGTKKGK